eukprot:COSAG01_NODE_5522_length_4206_cov_6.215973_3_plen_133_part_00
MIPPRVGVLTACFWEQGAYYSGGAWVNESGGGGKVVNEAAFKAIADGLRDKDLLDAVKIWQLDDWWCTNGLSSIHLSARIRLTQVAGCHADHTTIGGVYSACVSNWSLPRHTFPSGLKALSTELGTPWLLYV